MLVVDLNILAVAISGNFLVLLACVLYFFSLTRSAQNAAIYALPRRKFLSRFGIGRKALGVFTPKDAAPEHIDGRVDLASFGADNLDLPATAWTNAWVLFAKRTIDVVASLALIVFMAPLLLAVAIAVKLESMGPVLYKQNRVGKNGRIFRIFKFRSMSANAETNGATWAAASDDRITRVGSFIRKTRIDEIPQAINILLGDMSFVGPRPERPEFTSLLCEQIAHYDERHLVKPGLTGWAQVNFEYGASVEDAREKLCYDLYYIKNFSVLLDLFIIIKTVKVALLGIGSR